MKFIRLKQEHEESHIGISGDHGTGKSSLIRQILLQIERRGDVAVVFDSQKEFTPEFYRPDRGDWILSPIFDSKYEPCPYWNISDEVTDEADARAVAECVFPPPPENSDESSKFFHRGSVGALSYILAYDRPTTEQLGYYLAHTEELDKRFVGTEHQDTFSKNSPNQRGGLVGTLAQMGQALRMMPRDTEGRRRFCMREWVQSRKGCIFIPTDPAKFSAIKSLVSTWLDLAILRALAMGRRNDLPRIWFILDEVHNLQKLPQLARGLTQNRKTGNPFVVGYQHVGQLEEVYGKQADVMLSQPYSKFILATTDPTTAKRLSDMIGEIQFARLRQNRAVRVWDRNRDTEQIEYIREPLVLPSQIQGLQNKEGYFLQRGLVVKIAFNYLELASDKDLLRERIIPPMEKRPMQEPEEVITDEEVDRLLRPTSITAKRRPPGSVKISKPEDNKEA